MPLKRAVETLCEENIGRAPGRLDRSERMHAHACGAVTGLAEGNYSVSRSASSSQMFPEAAWYSQPASVAPLAAAGGLAAAAVTLLLLVNGLSGTALMYGP